MEDKTKRRLAGWISIGMLSGIYFFMIYVFFVTLVAKGLNLNSSDTGILFEILGFVIFLSPVREKITSNIVSVYTDWRKETVSRVVEVIAILTIIAGLLHQFSIPIMPFSV